MTYHETLDYLFEKLPMFSRIGSAAYKNSLDNILLLSERLGNPHQRFKTVHVAGTNGKGSVSHMLASVLQTAGYKTGLYTSPHLYDFRERIKIDGIMIAEDDVTDFVEKIKPLIEEIQPSFFEITVAMAFDYFAKENVDIAVIEVGLGGRLDSTNIITPIVSVITNISFDHINILGDTLPKIAAEKAGIIKHNVPIVIGQHQLETDVIFEETAKKNNAPIYFAADHFSLKTYQANNKSLQVTLSDNQEKEFVYETDLPGLYQLKNLATARQAIEILKQNGFIITEKNIEEGLKTVKQKTGLHGRWDVLSEKPTIVIEVAHNEDGVKQLLAHLTQIKFEKLHLILGLVKDKDGSKILSLLPKEATYYFTQAHIPRALEAIQLQENAAAFDLHGNVFENVNKAIEAAKTIAQPNDLIIICGSIFLAAEVDRDVFSK